MKLTLKDWTEGNLSIDKYSSTFNDIGVAHEGDVTKFMKSFIRSAKDLEEYKLIDKFNRLEFKYIKDVNIGRNNILHVDIDYDKMIKDYNLLDRNFLKKLFYVEHIDSEEGVEWDLHKKLAFLNGGFSTLKTLKAILGHMERNN